MQGGTSPENPTDSYNGLTHVYTICADERPMRPKADMNILLADVRPMRPKADMNI